MNSDIIPIQSDIRPKFGYTTLSEIEEALFIEREKENKEPPL